MRPSQSMSVSDVTLERGSEAGSGRPRSHQLAGWLVLAVAAAVSVLGLVADRAQRATTSTDEALGAALRVVRAGFRDGDAVAVVPTWEERPWALLEGAGPGAERAPWPALLRQAEVDPVDLLGFERVWVVGVHGRVAMLAPIASEDLAEVPLDPAAWGDGALGGSVSVRLFELCGFRRLARLSTSMETADVRWLDHDGAAHPCTPKHGRQLCGAQGRPVGVVTTDAFHADRTWVLVTTDAEAPGIQIGWRPPDSGFVVLRAAPTLTSVRAEGGSDVDVSLQVGGVSAPPLRLAPHVYTLGRRVLAVDAGQEVRVSVSAEDGTGRGTLLELDLISRVPATLEPGR